MTEVKTAEYELINQGEGWQLWEGVKRCPQGKPPTPKGWEALSLGGQFNPTLVYDPERYDAIWLSAQERQEYEAGILKVIGKVVKEFYASAHDCWKIKRNQKVLLVEKGTYFEYPSISEYAPYTPSGSEKERAIEVVREALRKKIIDGDELMRRTTRKIKSAFYGGYITEILFEKCPYCQERIKKTGDEYSVCLVHSINMSVASASYRREVGVINREDLPDDLKEKVDKIIISPTNAIDYAVLTTSGDALFIERPHLPAVKLNSAKANVF